MAWTKDYRSGHIYVDSTNVISGIRNLRIAAGSQIRKDITSGSPFPLAAHLVNVSPVASFQTYEILEALDNLPINGGCTTDLELFGQSQTCAGVPAGAVHNKYAVSNGSVVPTSLSVDHQGNAELNYDVYAASPDGSAAPIIKTSSQVMPAGTAGKRYEIYSLTVAGNVLEGKRNVSLNWNPQVSQEGADSNPWPTTVSLSSVQPVLSARGVDPDWIDSIGLSGDVGTAVNTILYLKDRDQLAATLAHVAIGMACQVSWNTLFDATPDAPGEAELQCDGYSVDGAIMLAVSTGIALP